MPKYNLSSTQLDELIQQYVEIVVDNMDTKDLVRYAIEQLISYYNEGSIDDLKEDVDSYDEELYDELVDNVTQQYPKQDVNNSTHTYSLNVNESISFPCSS